MFNAANPQARFHLFHNAETAIVPQYPAQTSLSHMDASFFDIN